jgi:hypothetical protein
VITVPSKGIFDTTIAAIRPAQNSIQFSVNFPVLAGMTIFVSAGAANNVILLFDP